MKAQANDSNAAAAVAELEATIATKVSEEVRRVMFHPKSQLRQQASTGKNQSKQDATWRTEKIGSRIVCRYWLRTRTQRRTSLPS